MLGGAARLGYFARMTLPIRAALLVAALLSLLVAPLAAAREEDDPSDLREFTCPVGGKPFRHNVAYSAFPLLTLPDGSWLGDFQIGVQIPVCPDNGLVLLPDLARSAAEDGQRIVYYDYTPEEIAALPALIADPGYRALAELGPYAQAAWIAGRIDRPAADRLFLLQRATWATADPALRKRLVERYVAEAPAVIDRLDGSEQVRAYQQMFVINGLRELGRFEEARAMLDALLESQTPVPGLPDPDAMFAPESPIAAMARAIAQRDDGRFAAETLPDRIFLRYCGGEMVPMFGPLSPATQAGCKARREREQAEADAIDQSFALRDDKAALEASCAASDAASRSRALQIACEAWQDEQDRIAGNLLAADGPALVAACSATPPGGRSGALASGCGNFSHALARAMGDLLADDPQALRLVCPDGEDSDGAGVPLFHSSACFDAYQTLKERRKQAMLADPVNLGLRCFYAREEETGPDYALLLDACSQMEDDKRQAAIARLATDAAAFDATCGRFGRTNKAGNDVYGLTEEQDQCRRAWRLRENTRAREAAEAKGLKCFHDVIYSPDRPECVDPEEYARRMAPPGRDGPGPGPYDMSWLDEGSSLMAAARVAASELVATAKAEGRFRWPDL